MGGPGVETGRYFTKILRDAVKLYRPKRCGRNLFAVFLHFKQLPV